MRRKGHNVFAGFVIVLAVVLGAAVSILLAIEYGRDRSDYVSLATMEAEVILKTVMVAIQTTASMRSDLQDAGVATNVIQEVVYKCGTGRLLQRLGTQGMFDYLVCQGDEGIVAGYGVSALSSVSADPFLQEALATDSFSTRVLTGLTTRIEAVLPFQTDKKKSYLLRVAIGMGTVARIEQRKMLRMAVVGGAMVMLMLVFIMYLFNVHNTRLLARERDTITGEVKLMQEQLRQQERASAMGRLAAAVAHEVRNPLNAIQLLMERLERETKATPDTAAKFTEFTRVIRGEMKRLNKIVKDFTEFSRAKAPVFVTTDPVALARDVCCLEQGEMQERSIMLRQDFGSCAPIMADPAQLAQALLNILKNAVEATSAGGEIVVRVAQDGEGTKFSVEDTGAGFTPESREHAYDLYFSTKEGGSGIGLAVTRRIVELHNGVIALHARAPQGAIVEITLPHEGA